MFGKQRKIEKRKRAGEREKEKIHDFFSRQINLKCYRVQMLLSD